ncbi:MAG: 5'-3' exonuclease [Verrucomicrobiota bacterium]
MSLKRLLLIDGMAVVYRAFFAIRNISTSGGQPTNAVFGFVRMVRQLQSRWKPTHEAVIFDGGLPQRRMDLHAEYKAQRPDMPDDLRAQKPVVEEYLDAAGLCRAIVDSEEADDVIASIVARYRERFDEILIATGDKDMFQLVDGKVKVIPVAGKEDLLDTDGVRAKTGVEPQMVPDWLALVGDASDNIPGVKGIGRKTAAKVLNEHGPLRQILAGNPGGEQEKVLSRILKDRDLVLKNLQMVSLKDDLDCPFSPEEMEVTGGDNRALIDFCRKWEFDSIARELEQGQLL